MSTLIFKINYLESGNCTVFIVGNIPELGAWDPKKSIQLYYEDGIVQTKEILLEKVLNANNIEYKYIKCKCSNLEKDIIWEDGANKRINLM